MSATKRTRSDSEMEMVESPPTKKRILFESSSNSQKSLNCSESMDVSSHSNDENKDSSNIIKENKENSLNKITTLLSTQKTLCDDILENMLDMESLHRSYTPEAKFLKYVSLSLSLSFDGQPSHSPLSPQVQKRYRGVVDRYL